MPADGEFLESPTGNNARVTMMSDPKDYSEWLTKAQVAQALGVSTKTVEKLATNSVIQRAKWHRPGKPMIVVYHPQDVERERMVRGASPQPFVVPPETKPLAIVPAVAKPSIPDAAAVMLADALAAFVRNGSPTPDSLFLTLGEASHYCGLSKALLRRYCKRWEAAASGFGVDAEFRDVSLLPFIRDGRSIRIRKSDLEKLTADTSF